MVERAYPPNIDNVLPPIEIIDRDGKEWYKLTIPFEFTGFTTAANLSGIYIKLRESMSNNQIGPDFYIPDFLTQQDQSNYIDLDNRILYAFLDLDSIGGKKPQATQYYKIQIAFKIDSSDTVGYFSNYGVAKCLRRADFEIGIKKFSNSNVQIYNLDSVTGFFKSKDLSEIPVKYKFDLYCNTELIDSTGFLIHNNNSSNNEITTENRISYDFYNFITEFQPYQEYYINYTVETNNGLILSSSNNNFSKITLFSINFTCEIDTELDQDNGQILIKINHSMLSGRHANQFLVKGKFKIFRTSDKTNFNAWEQIGTFRLPSTTLNKETLVYIDYLIEQGVSYKYAISAIMNEGLDSEQSSSKIIMDNIITADFETAYLYDKNYQLAIKYNPKVSSLKTTKLEQKTDTLGGVYPYFSRNHNTNYKEIPISGLISILMDDQALFSNGIKFYNKKLYDKYNTDQNGPEAEMGPFRQQTWSAEASSNFKNYHDTDLVSENFRIERDFKLSILDWLNNGELKVFKSPGEGNYIVRLMNVSLSPQDNLGRMLHTFQCTAYEADEYNIKNLIKYNLLSLEPDQVIELQPEEVTGELNEDGLYYFDLSRYEKITQIDFIEFPISSEIFGYNINNEPQLIPTPLYSFNDQEFSLTNNVDGVKLVTSNQVKNLTDTKLIIHFGDLSDEEFYDIDEMYYDKIVVRQYISESYDGSTSSIIFSDDIDALTDDKQFSSYIETLVIKVRPIVILNDEPVNYATQEVTVDVGSASSSAPTDEDPSEPIDNSISSSVDDDLNNPESSESLSDCKYYSNRISSLPNPLYLYQFENKYYSQDIYGVVHIYSTLNTNCNITKGDTNISITDAENHEYLKLSDITSIELGNGRYCELAYPVIRVTYAGEQSWRINGNKSWTDGKDNDILSGWIENQQSYNDNTEDSDFINENAIESIDIVIDRYSFFEVTSRDDLFENNQINSTRQNGKYFSDRIFIIEEINGVSEFVEPPEVTP